MSNLYFSWYRVLPVNFSWIYDGCLGIIWSCSLRSRAWRCSPSECNLISFLPFYLPSLIFETDKLHIFLGTSSLQMLGSAGFCNWWVGICLLCYCGYYVLCIFRTMNCNYSIAGKTWCREAGYCDHSTFDRLNKQYSSCRYSFQWLYMYSFLRAILFSFMGVHNIVIQFLEKRKDHFLESYHHNLSLNLH